MERLRKSEIILFEKEPVKKDRNLKKRKTGFSRNNGPLKFQDGGWGVGENSQHRSKIGLMRKE